MSLIQSLLSRRSAFVIKQKKHANTQKCTSKHTSHVVFLLTHSLTHTLWIVIKMLLLFLHGQGASTLLPILCLWACDLWLPPGVCCRASLTQEREKERERVLNVLLFGPRFSISLACPQRHVVPVCFTAIAHPLPDILHRSHTLHSSHALIPHSALPCCLRARSLPLSTPHQSCQAHAYLVHISPANVLEYF